MTEYSYYVEVYRQGQAIYEERANSAEVSANTPCPVSAVSYLTRHLTETLAGIDTEVASGASEPCQVEVTGYVCDEKWELIGTAIEIIELEPLGRKLFELEVEIPSGYWDIHGTPEVTDVEIEY